MNSESLTDAEIDALQAAWEAENDARVTRAKARAAAFVIEDRDPTPEEIREMAASTLNAAEGCSLATRAAEALSRSLSRA